MKKMLIAMAVMAMMASSAMAQQQSRGMKRMDSRSSVECKMMRQDMRGGKGRDMRGQFKGSPKAKAMQKRHMHKQMACCGSHDARFCRGGRDCFHGHHHHHDKVVVIRI